MRLLIFAFFSFVLSSGQVFAQSKAAPASDPQAQALAGLIINMFQNNNGTLVCPGANANPQNIGEGVIKYLKASLPQGQGNNVSVDMVNNALLVLHPCPFSPFRDELVPATPADVAGAWVYPNGSQKFRYPPKAKVPLPTGGRPIACDGIGFFDKGEMRTALVPGPKDCPFTKAADIEAERIHPRVLTWAMPSPGRLQVTRSDSKVAPEDWQTLVVKTAFEQYGVAYKPGDIVMYLRRASSGAAEEFRHLQRLK